MKNRLEHSADQFGADEQYNNLQPHQAVAIPEMKINKGLVIGGAFGIMVAVFLLINLFMSPALTFSVDASETGANEAIEAEATGGGGGGGGGSGGGGGTSSADDIQAQTNASQDTTTKTWHRCTICGTDVTGIENDHFTRMHNGRGSYTIEERTVVK